MDHGFTRAKESWEMTDGAIFLLREASAFEDMHDFVVSSLEKLSDLGYVDHFKHYHFMKQNLFKSICKIIQNMGKKKFRGHVELFLDPAFRTAKVLEHQNMALAAQDFIMFMEKTYGPGIFKAIVEGHDERYLADLQRFKEEASRMPVHDFVYNPKQAPSDIPGDIMLTKAPWAK